MLRFISYEKRKATTSDQLSATTIYSTTPLTYLSLNLNNSSTIIRIITNRYKMKIFQRRASCNVRIVGRQQTESLIIRTSSHTHTQQQQPCLAASTLFTHHVTLLQLHSNNSEEL